MPVGAQEIAPLSTPSPPGRCRVCGAASGAWAVCFCCSTAVRQLQMPLVPVEVMVEYRLGDPLHRLLRGYKDGSIAATRQCRSHALSVLIDRWLSAHRPAVVARFGSSWDTVVTAPSTSRRRPAPVDGLVAAVPDLARVHRRLLVRGGDPMDHLRAARHGYEVPGEIDRSWLRKRRVLVFDDSLVTGSRVQSAAAALRRGGAVVVGALVVGRVVPPHPVP